MDFRLFIESLEDWHGKWVHYSKTPYLKINYKPFHYDPLGIYLFPQEFNPFDMWRGYRYKFIVEIPSSLKVLDLSKITDIQKAEMAEVAGTELKNLETNNWWTRLTSVFSGRPGAFNAFFRKMGYDAIFDDTKSIHRNEIQLLVLDPRKLKVIERIDQSSSGYNELLEVMELVVDRLREYGKISSTLPKKGYNHWAQQTKVEGAISVESGKDNFRLKLYTHCLYSKEGSHPDMVYVVYLGSEPYLENIRVITTINLYNIRDVEWQHDLDKVMERWQSLVSMGR